MPREMTRPDESMTDEQAAEMCSALDGRPVDEWLPAVQAWRRAQMPVADIFVGIMLGNDPTPAKIERLAVGTVAYRMADASDGVAELRDDMTATWRKARQGLRHALRRR